ncbi:MAG: peptide chain release factor N(5)-glutamine methyltransferase [Bacteroidota bacterium]
MGDTKTRWTRASLITKSTRELEAVNIGDARRNVEWILCELLKCNRASLYAHPEAEIPPAILPVFEAMLDRRQKREPLQYILGYTIFCGLRIDVTPDVLIPRPETESLVVRATEILSPIQKAGVLDIGAGSGCIPLAIKHAAPDARVSSCDVSHNALAIAKKNATALDLDVHFFHNDILTKKIQLPEEEKFHLIISNPPYIPETEYLALDTEVKDHEPGLALTTGDDPLRFYRAIAQAATQRLHQGGHLLVETHCDYANATADCFKDAGFINAQVLQDLTGRDRFVRAYWP